MSPAPFAAAAAVVVAICGTADTAIAGTDGEHVAIIGIPGVRSGEAGIRRYSVVF